MCQQTRETISANSQLPPSHPGRIQAEDPPDLTCPPPSTRPSSRAGLSWNRPRNSPHQSEARVGEVLQGLRGTQLIPSLLVGGKEASGTELEEGAFISRVAQPIRQLKPSACVLVCDNRFVILAGNPRQFRQLPRKPKGNSYRMKRQFVLPIDFRELPCSGGPQMRTRDSGLG